MAHLKHILGATLALCIGAVTANAQVPLPGSVGSGSSLNGAGSTFVQPVMSKWTYDYANKTKEKINYQPIGSGGGIRQFISKTVDFGATDSPMTEEQLKEAADEAIHIPVVLGAVAVTYSLEGIEKPLNLSGPTIARIFMGEIKKWDDPAIAAENPGVKLPDSEIIVVRRSDGSGTTFTFAEFLGKASPMWKEKMGASTALNWPVGVGAKGNSGVAAQVQRTPNSIGYVELVYALQNKMPVANVRNAENEYVRPSEDSVTAAAKDLKDVPADLRMSITYAPGKEAYPIAGITWLLVRPKLADEAKQKSLKNFVTYVLSEEAQSVAPTLSYSRLPENLLQKAQAQAAKLK